jgi:1-deoxy-D-xylulose-5-phosphate synthase
MKPVVAIYSTFLQRAYDQLIHDVVLQNLPVTFAIDRAGVVGADGATHIGAFDLAYLRCLPNTTVMAPPTRTSAGRCSSRPRPRHAGGRALSARIRSGRGIDPVMRALPIGKAQVRRTTSRRTQRIAILAFGSMVHPALAAAEELDATVVDMRFVKPIDVDPRDGRGTRSRRHRHGRGGRGRGRRGECVAEALAAQDMSMPLLHLGLPTCSSTTATRRSCSRRSVSTPGASRRASARASTHGQGSMGEARGLNRRASATILRQ